MDFDDSRFQGQIDGALQVIKNVLDKSKKPKEATKVFHQYSDKFELVDLLTNVAIVSQFNCLSYLGLENIDTVKAWNQKGSSCTLRFQSTEKCTFIREEERKEDSSTTSVSTSGIFGNWSISAKEQRKVKYYYWKFELEYEVFFFPGNNPNEKISLATKKGQCEVMTVGTNSPPYPETKILPPIDLNITWLLQSITENDHSKFAVDRSHAKCRTPRRNPDVNTAMDYFRRCYLWSDSVEKYFIDTIFPINPVNEKDRPDFNNLNDKSMFIPVIPLFQDSSKKKAIEKGKETESAADVPLNKGPVLLGYKSDSTTLLPISDYNLCLQEQLKTHNAKMEDLKKMFPKDDKRFVSLTDASLLVKIMHLKKTCVYYCDSLNYVENMLRTQLIAAIGKEVSPLDFTNYMLYHNRKLFKLEYEPIAFSYAVRLPDHYPEGIFGIDFQFSDGSISEPIQTTVRKSIARKPMNFNINAATTISFYGDRYLHAYVGHQFSKSSGVQLKLTARARQFSSYILLLGRISSHDVFDPQYATIVQNKDDLEIPLMLETIPSPKEFKERIWSLSPEQQRFAKAYRSLQLASTLFGICIIQIKPQLEKLLKLPYDSLTKEIKMNQQLMELFIKYQIPSDLLSCDLENAESANAIEKLDVVRKYIDSMRDMIKNLREEDLAKKKQEEEFQRKQALMDENIVRPRKQVVRKASFSSDDESSEDDYDCEVNECNAYSTSFNSMPMIECKSSRFEENLECEEGGLLITEAINTTAPTSTVETVVQEVQEVSVQPTSPPTTQPSEYKGAQTVEFEGVKKPIIDPDSLPVSVVEEADEDVSKLPQTLNSKFKALDTDSALRPTIINVSNTWKKRSQKTIISTVEENTLTAEDLDKEKVKAYDLLDALSRSGCLSFDYASLHVVVASTHCFDKTLMDTVIQDNVNPIEKVERSALIVATAIHNKDSDELVKPDQLERVSTYSPMLFDSKENDAQSITEKKTKKSRSKK